MLQITTRKRKIIQNVTEQSPTIQNVQTSTQLHRQWGREEVTWIFKNSSLLIFTHSTQETKLKTKKFLEAKMGITGDRSKKANKV